MTIGQERHLATIDENLRKIEEKIAEGENNVNHYMIETIRAMRNLIKDQFTEIRLLQGQVANCKRNVFVGGF